MQVSFGFQAGVPWSFVAVTRLISDADRCMARIRLSHAEILQRSALTRMQHGYALSLNTSKNRYPNTKKTSFEAQFMTTTELWRSPLYTN